MSAESKVVDLMAALEDSVNAAKAARVAAQRDRYRAALEDIAGGECWQTRCPDGDLCDTCTARKALGRLA